MSDPIGGPSVLEGSSTGSLWNRIRLRLLIAYVGAFVEVFVVGRIVGDERRDETLCRLSLRKVMVGHVGDLTHPRVRGRARDGTVHDGRLSETREHAVTEFKHMR